MKTKNSEESVFDLSAQALDYSLPNDRIARYPLPERDQSKLLFWHNGTIEDSAFTRLPEFLPEHSLLIFNNTRVIHARLHFQKKTGAHIEIFCLDPANPADYQISFQQTQTCSWHCMVGNLKKWKQEDLTRELQIEGHTVRLTASKLSQTDQTVTIQFSWNCPEIDFATLIDHAGILPIPPYLHRETEQSDLDRYQTVYSKINGSVAAPTAGLHFTDRIFESLSKKNIDREEITLHVGAGTFKPVKSETIGEHEMHAEQIIVQRELLKKILHYQGPLIAVGTTSIRTLESLYWIGVQLHNHPELPVHDLKVDQWTPYTTTTVLNREEAIKAIIAALDKAQTSYLIASTRIIIVPGYNFRLISGMITNFHQPQSTLLLLISAFVGDDWERIYQHALENNYRFLSYGDSNLYLKDNR